MGGANTISGDDQVFINIKSKGGIVMPKASRINRQRPMTAKANPAISKALRGSLNKTIANADISTEILDEQKDPNLKTMVVNGNNTGEEPRQVDQSFTQVAQRRRITSARPKQMVGSLIKHDLNKTDYHSRVLSDETDSAFKKIEDIKTRKTKPKKQTNERSKRGSSPVKSSRTNSRNPAHSKQFITAPIDEETENQ